MENAGLSQRFGKGYDGFQMSAAFDGDDPYLSVYADIRRVSLPRLSIRAFTFSRADSVSEEALEMLSEHELYFVKEGSLSFIVNGETTAISAGECLSCQPGDLRCREEGQAPVTFLYLRFWQDGDMPLSKMRELPHKIPYRHDPDLLTSLDFLERVCETPSPDQRRKCLAGLQLLLAQLEDFVVRYSESDCVRAMKAYILDHYREGVQLQDLADHVGFHPVSCARIFKKEEGITVGAFINQLRVCRAAEQLEYTVETSDVARDLGLSEFYFSRWFKQMTGFSPTEYRDALRAGYVRE